MSMLKKKIDIIKLHNIKATYVQLATKNRKGGNMNNKASRGGRIPNCSLLPTYVHYVGYSLMVLCALCSALVFESLAVWYSDSD